MAARLNDGDDFPENSEINVTPFIDVMLVLLIIFMVAAPLSTVDIPVDLPVSNAAPKPKPQKPIFVTLKKDLTIAVGENAVPIDRLGMTLDMETQLDREQRVFIRADQTTSYGELTRLMNALRAAGYIRLALVGLEGGSSTAAPEAAQAQP
jgi:biopolymer transport protein ExbD